MKNKILSLLKSNKNNFISGEKISNTLGVSRASVWKHINALKADGYLIESISRRGYMLTDEPDLLTYGEIKEYLKTEYIGHNFKYYETINSTNIKAKSLAELGEPEGTIVISEEQTMGRGRLGKEWISPKYKGIWMSIILRPDINPAKVAKITMIGATSVCNAVKEIGVDTYIKWPNDIIIDNKKVCGILTEMSAELNIINYIVLGIGINVNINNEEFPASIKNIAASLKDYHGSSIKRKELAGKVLNNFEILYDEFLKTGNIKSTIKICREKSTLLGKEITILKNNNYFNVRAVDISDDGELVVKHNDGSIEKLISAEVSIKKK